MKRGSGTGGPKLARKPVTDGCILVLPCPPFPELPPCVCTPHFSPNSPMQRSLLHKQASLRLVVSTVVKVIATAVDISAPVPKEPVTLQPAYGTALPPLQGAERRQLDTHSRSCTPI